MNPVSVAVGAVAICIGLYTSFLRITNPSKLSKLEPMKRMWGDGPGNALHLIAYSVVPLAAGIWFVIRGVRGEAVF